MKKALTGIAAAIALSSSAWAVPTLQLDISNGVYVGGDDETVYSQGDQFTLSALISGGIQPNTTYYISAAIVPRTGSGAAFGSFSIDGVTYDLNDMTFGTPPVDDPDFNPLNIGTHDIFQTSFLELPFTPNAANRATEYNSQDDPGGLVVNAAGTLIYHNFEIDVSGLDAGFALHFDLYTVGTTTQGRRTGDKITAFAPFSHDAQSGNGVPDGGVTLVLLGAGMLGVGALRRRISK